MSASLGQFFHSIRFRLAVWFAAILAVVLISFSIFVYISQARQLSQDTREKLNLKTQRWELFLAEYGREEFEHNRTILPNDVFNGVALLQEGDTMVLVTGSGDVIQKVGAITQADIQPLINAAVNQDSQGGAISYEMAASSQGITGKPEQYLVTVSPILSEGQLAGYFILGSPVDPNRQMPRLALTLAAGNLLMLSLALIGGYWLADRAMRPVKAITYTARQIGETDLSRRLNLKTQDELGELANTFDQMLARLQAAFERQRQFTADASHELRTPLTIVGLEANRLLSGKRSSQEVDQALSVIQSENEFMSRLVNNLLTLSRMDAGQAGLQLKEMDLSDAALEAVERLEPVARQRGVSLSTGELPETPVLGDRQYLGQMIANLVENGIKYSRQQGANVHVETGFDPTKRQAWVSVSDNGPGINPQHLPRLFDRFYQIDQVRSHNEPQEGDRDGIQASGSGLGLSIVDWIARAHQGQVKVESQPGNGTKFTIYIPSITKASKSP